MRYLFLILALLLAGCLVEPRETASGEIISSYNTQLLTFWGTVATGVLLFLGQIVAIVMNSRSAKKSEAAIVAANHTNQKLMSLTEKLTKTDEKSNATDRVVENLKNGSHPTPVTTAPPIVVVVPIPAAPATSLSASATATEVGTVSASNTKKPNMDIKADETTVDASDATIIIEGTKKLKP